MAKFLELQLQHQSFHEYSGKKDFGFSQSFFFLNIDRSETLNYKVELALNKNDSVVLHFSSEGLGSVLLHRFFMGLKEG